MTDKPSEKEDEYFIRQEFDRVKQIEEKRQKALAEEERLRLKDLHYMRCPKCGMQLLEIDYRNIKIDKCSECGGVWLDAGEMESILELDKSLIDKFFRAFKK